MSKHDHFTTPCGFEIWLISWPGSGALGWRVYFGSEEIGFDRMRGRISREGALMLAEKINELYGGANA